MKIVLVNTLYEPYAIGGAEFSTKILAENLAKEHEVYVITAGLKDEIIRKNGVIVIYKQIPHIFNRYESNRQGFLSKVLWRIYEYVNFYPFYLFENILSKIDPDVVHTNNIAMFTPRIWKAASKFAKVIHTTRDYYLICARSSMLNGKGDECREQCAFCKRYTGRFKKYRSYVDEFVFISEHVKEQHQKYFGAEGAIIYNAIGDLKVDESQPIYNERNRFVLGYIGLVSELKGVDRIIKIANTLKVHTVIAGEIASGEGHLKKQIDRSEYITYLGFTNQRNFFKRIDILLHLPRWNEPMGRTVVEAFSFGKPVITLEKGGLKDLVDDGVDGFYVAENNFANQINTILNDLKQDSAHYHKMKEAALQSSKRFNTENYINNYLDVYK